MDYKKDYLDGIRDLENLNKFEDDTVLLMHNLRMNRSKLNNNPQIGESYTQLTMHDPKFIKSNPFEGLEINPIIEGFYTEMASHIKKNKRKTRFELNDTDLPYDSYFESHLY